MPSKIIIILIILLVATAGIFVLFKTDPEPAVITDKNKDLPVSQKNNGSVDLVRPPFLDE